MTEAEAFRTGKGHRDENFPVASRLVAARYRAPILAFYEFVRTADDVADSPTLAPGEKHAWLDRLEASLDGAADETIGTRLRAILAERGLSDRHARDLLAAFRLDVDKLAYESFDDLMGYCSLSAMPVGRFVLDVHGVSRATWPHSDAICAALQIINHLQDCGRDWRALRRCYLPRDLMAECGADPTDLAGERLTPALAKVVHILTNRCRSLLDDGASLPDEVGDMRLACEIAVIVELARRICDRLDRNDPLVGGVHLDKPAALLAATKAAGACAFGRLTRTRMSMQSKAKTP
jgi:squalene synthase HpnC